MHVVDLPTHSPRDVIGVSTSAVVDTGRVASEVECRDGAEHSSVADDSTQLCSRFVTCLLLNTYKRHCEEGFGDGIEVVSGHSLNDPAPAKAA